MNVDVNMFCEGILVPFLLLIQVLLYIAASSNGRAVLYS